MVGNFSADVLKKMLAGILFMIEDNDRAQHRAQIPMKCSLRELRNYFTPSHSLSGGVGFVEDI